jgi:prepilin-type N-terminal cleavage/methylation domain-containing protein
MHINYFKKTKNRGFTLLELLVVISIIGILMAMGVVAYTNAQQKGRDARRRADLQAIQDAQEQHYATNGSYARLTGTPCNVDSAFSTSFGALLRVFPIDPKPGSNYSCSSSPAQPQPVTSYCICADVEDNKGNASTTNCTIWNPAGNGGYYCVTNLQ